MEAVIERKQTSFRFRADLLERLKALANSGNHSLNSYVESLLMDAVYQEPNETTKQAIAEARKGEFAGYADTGSLEAFIKSCE